MQNVCVPAFHGVFSKKPRDVRPAGPLSEGGPLMRTRLCPLRFIRVFLVVAALLACVANADAGGGTRHCVTKTGAGSRNGDG